MPLTNRKTSSTAWMLEKVTTFQGGSFPLVVPGGFFLAGLLNDKVIGEIAGFSAMGAVAITGIYALIQSSNQASQKQKLSELQSLQKVYQEIHAYFSYYQIFIDTQTYLTNQLVNTIKIRGVSTLKQEFLNILTLMENQTKNLDKRAKEFISFLAKELNGIDAIELDNVNEINNLLDVIIQENQQFNKDNLKLSITDTIFNLIQLIPENLAIASMPVVLLMLFQVLHGAYAQAITWHPGTVGGTFGFGVITALANCYLNSIPNRKQNFNEFEKLHNEIGALLTKLEPELNEQEANSNSIQKQIAESHLELHKAIYELKKLNSVIDESNIKQIFNQNSIIQMLMSHDATNETHMDKPPVLTMVKDAEQSTAQLLAEKSDLFNKNDDNNNVVPNENMQVLVQNNTNKTHSSFVKLLNCGFC